MSLTIKPGTRLYSAVCSAEFIVTKAPAGEVDLTIGGVAPLESSDGRDGSSEIEGEHGGGALMGKRYVDADDSLEVLCTKAGDGVPAIAGTLLVLKDTKPLPASD
jgi:hypothetical protein